jgi:hypothetical protein
MMISIDAYPIRPGRLIEWALHPISIEHPQQDSRPASYIQEEHIRATASMRASGKAASNWLATAFELPKIDIQTLEMSLLHLISQHETLRSGFKLNGSHLRRFTYEPNDLELQATDVGDFETGEDIASYLQARFAATTDPVVCIFPTLYVAVIHDDSATIFIASDHSRTDGYSLFLAPQELHDIRTKILHGESSAEPLKIGSHLDFSKEEREKAQQVTANHPGVLLWKEFTDTFGGELPEFPLDRGVYPGDHPPTTGCHRLLLEKTQIDLFAAVCKKTEEPLLPGLLAVAAMAVSELSGTKNFHTTMPVHTRHGGPWSGSIGWFVNLLPISIPVIDGSDFSAMLTVARQSLRTASPAKKVPRSRAWELNGTVSPFRSMISFMDLCDFPGSANWDNWNVAVLGNPPPGDYVNIWLMRTHQGLEVTTVYPDTAECHITISEYLDRISNIMSIIASTGTYCLGTQSSRMSVAHLSR